MNTKKPNKRAANRQKLKTLEWTDDAIEECQSAGTKFFEKFDTEAKDEKYINTMESKIARVQMRKKEAEEREVRKKKYEDALPKENLSVKQFTVANLTPAQQQTKLSEFLNQYFVNYIRSNTSLLENHNFTHHFPLALYDSSEFDERLLFPKKFPISAVCLAIQTTNNSRNAQTDDDVANALGGKWYPGEIVDMKIDPNNGTAMFKVELSGTLFDETVYTSALNLCLIPPQFSLQTYVQRIEMALVRRNHCVALMKYFTFIQCMPNHQLITSTMTAEQHARILQKSAPTKYIYHNTPGQANPPITTINNGRNTTAVSFGNMTGRGSTQSGTSKGSMGAATPYGMSNKLLTLATATLEDCKVDYEMIMNQLLFHNNMLSLQNKSFYSSLALPTEIFTQSYENIGKQKTPYLGIIRVAHYNYKTRSNYHKSSSYLSSLAAIYSLQMILKEMLAVESYEIIKLAYTKPFILDRFDRYLGEQLLTANRALKQEWPMKSGQQVRQLILKFQEGMIVPPSVPPAHTASNISLSGMLNKDANATLTPASPPSEGIVYDVNLRNVYEFDKTTNAIKSFLDRMNYMMSHLLKTIITRNYTNYAELVEDLCSCQITVKDIKNIHVVVPEGCIYKRQVLPPLFLIAFRIAAEDHCLNQEDIDKNKQEIANWMKTKEAENGEKCPVKLIQPVMGKVFEYSIPLNDFKEMMVKGFRLIIQDFLDIPHVQKFVLEKIYFPNPRFIDSIVMELPEVQLALQRVEKAMDKAILPLSTYLTFFKKYETFVNINNQQYISSRIQIQTKDPESQEVELPVSMNLTQVISLINEHYNNIQEIEESLPITPIECGLFLVDVVSVRNLLLEKHRTIIRAILSTHAEYCEQITAYLDEEFKKILKKILQKPENIEQLVELEEYMSSLPNILTALQNCINDMMSYFNILETFKYKMDMDSGLLRWSIFGFPNKIVQKCTEVNESNAAIKRRFRDEMMGEQANFLKVLHDLDHQVNHLEQLHDLNDVNINAIKVSEVEQRLQQAQQKVKLYNARETLFEQDVTDYEELNRIQRNFEPYANLWQTSREWLELSHKWKTGRFIDLNADEIEKNVDKYNIAITKAAKYFTKSDMKNQTAIANKIKAQVQEFLPEVPMIVTLRNPGMRDRHWEKIAQQLQVDILPIDNFTTEQIIAMNLKDSLELIQKIGESAAKEYQIEQALDKMEREWENMNLNIHNYRETGTGVLKGVDDINVILDEQITMTQTIMFSAFKGPFEQRIDEWNRKLCCVSDVLEVWVVVQRNWLYLQPIFESPDINRQLPTEGKKFSTVDKSWRQTISAGKLKPKVIEFCDNQKLLERFQESEILLDQVQKGLSDYLETKRSVFARFYFLSNDELLSILSESKDVKLVQPHLKKCFEGIDKVKFLADLTIDRMISPEGEEIMLTAKINPVEKNVECWMLELEGMMRMSIRDVMGKAIADYTQTPRPRWMQKWAGMCVLNGSQMHWTREMEELFITEGSNGPTTMYQRQISQLADMTILVRGKLSSAARITVGALTVIDVHARDVIKKLVDEAVDTKDNFSWTSQLRYYWEGGELLAQMVAATRPYGYEYLGNSFRLVITPLTDKCYLTLMGALQMIFGGAPAGPAGTGKTETTKGK